MTKFLLLLSLLSPLLHAEQPLSVPAQLKLGRYLVAKPGKYCFEAAHVGIEQTAIFVNAMYSINLLNQPPVDSDVEPGCQEASVTTSANVAGGTEFVETVTTLCAGRPLEVSEKRTWLITEGKIHLKRELPEWKKPVECDWTQR